MTLRMIFQNGCNYKNRTKSLNSKLIMSIHISGEVSHQVMQEITSFSMMYLIVSINHKLNECAKPDYYCIQGKFAPVLFLSFSPSDLRVNFKLD